MKGITEMLVDISVPSSTISPTNMAGGVRSTSSAEGHPFDQHPLNRFARQDGRMGWNKEAYIQHFEAPFLNETKTYYEAESRRLSELSVIEFIDHAEQRSAEEELRLKTLMDAEESGPKLRS
eukprot:Selendium_serpulae@DN6288_c0_g4_i1.p1